MAKDSDLINIGECVGNCNSATAVMVQKFQEIFRKIIYYRIIHFLLNNLNLSVDYRFVFHQMYGNGYKIKGCTILETEPLRVVKGRSPKIRSYD